MKKKVIAVVGPTACGKTALAIKIAKEINGEVISADSRLVYKGFNIATAKPTLEEQDGIPHHLIDIVEPERDYSAGDYYRDAKRVIDDIYNRSKIPIVAGGTGLYFRILLENYNLPEVDTDYKLRATLENLKTDDLLRELKKLDLKTYEQLKSANKRRIIRYLEIIKTLNKPISELNLTKEPEYDVEWIVPEMISREWLYERINKRVDFMLEQGLLEETRQLLNKHGRIPNLVCTIGYKEVLSYIDGECSLQEAIDKLKQHSRNYAKRQLTWFRKNPNLDINI